MNADSICKTIHQYSKGPVPEEVMRKLLDIAADYQAVKNYVYIRYGGTGSLAKLYPGYTIQNEMTKTDLRQNLGMPSVYFYLAIFDALGDIKSQWTRTKSKVLQLIGQNERFTAEEQHYLRFLIKTGNAFAAVLQQEPVKLPADIQKKYGKLAEAVDTGKLHRYLCRQVRKYHVKLHTDIASGFSIAERAYRYGDHGIYISTKENRRRVFIPLTDNNQYKCQLYVKLYPEDSHIEIRVPVNISTRVHEDYTNQIGLSVGMFTMLTTDTGHGYGEKLGEMQNEYSTWMREQTSCYSRNRAANPGRKKYHAKKSRYEERIHTYINQEINRFLQTEKPQTIYIVKLPKPNAGGVNRKINNSVTMWQRGYIRKRLMQKCREQSVGFVEVLGKNISNECSRCGFIGSKKGGIFTCKSCGYSVEEKTNTAKNALIRGLAGKIIY